MKTSPNRTSSRAPKIARATRLLAAAALLTPGASTFVTGSAAVILVASAPTAEASPYRRSVRRTARRTTRRVVRRRHLWAMPVGVAPVMMGGYRYYHHGGAYYYPYMQGGRTIYIEVNPQGPPPPAYQVMGDIGY